MKNWCSSCWNIRCLNTCPMSKRSYGRCFPLCISGGEYAKRSTGLSAPVDIRELIGDLTLAKLQNIFNSIIKRQENKVDPIRSKFGKIEKEEVSLEDKMSDLELYAGTHHYFSFRGLLERQSGKIQVIVTFLAILELMKTGVITIEQEHLFDDIQITSLIYEEQQADGETGSSD